MGNIIGQIYHFMKYFNADIEKREVVDFLVEEETVDKSKREQICNAYFPDEKSIENFKDALEYEIELLDKNMEYYTYHGIDYDKK